MSNPTNPNESTADKLARVRAAKAQREAAAVAKSEALEIERFELLESLERTRAASKDPHSRSSMRRTSAKDSSSAKVDG